MQLQFPVGKSSDRKGQGVSAAWFGESQREHWIRDSHSLTTALYFSDDTDTDIDIESMIHVQAEDGTVVCYIALLNSSIPASGGFSVD